MQDFFLTFFQDAPYLKSAALLGVSVFITYVSPGPSIALVIKNTVAYSRQAGLACAFGVALAVLCFVIIALLGMGVILQKSEIIYRLVQGVGGLFLTYVGIMSFKHAGTTDYSANEGAAATRSSFTEGFFITILNPQAILAFMAISATYIIPTTPFYIQVLYALEIMILCFAWFGTAAYILSMPQLKERFLSKIELIERVTATFLFLMGAYILYSAVQ